MRVNGYKCDDCGNVNNGEEALKGWFAVYGFRKGVSSDEQHFCTIGCLSAWALKQKRGEPIEYVDPHGGSLFTASTALEIINEAVDYAVNEYWRDL